MLKQVKSINFTLNNSTFNEYKNEIESFWKKYSKENPELFNGYVVSVQEIKELEDNSYDITINLLKYCEISYSKIIGNIKTRPFFSGGYIKTKDNYICFVIKQNSVVDLVGGLASNEDFVNDIYNPDMCLIREFKEEMGIDITSKNIDIKYLKYPNEIENEKSFFFLGIIYEIKLDLSMEELNALFKSKNHDDELKSLLFLKDDDYNILDKYDKKNYIDELFNLIKD